MLYLVSTPIGNLEDMSFRAIKTLGECDEILCEDTRHSLVLLHHYNIKKPLRSYHKFNEAKQLEPIIEQLQLGRKIALICDAGTPGISDPGERLVKATIEQGVEVIAIPGPCAAIAALSCSGLPTGTFQFVGFLPKKVGELQRTLIRALTYRGTTICYESPRRLIKVLEHLHALQPEAHVAVARELTKTFEEVKRGTPEELITYWKTSPLKGEIVLLIEGGNLLEDTLPPEERVAWLEKTFNISRKEAIKLVAELWGLSRRELYKKTV